MTSGLLDVQTSLPATYKDSTLTCLMAYGKKDPREKSHTLQHCSTQAWPCTASDINSIPESAHTSQGPKITPSLQTPLFRLRNASNSGVRTEQTIKAPRKLGRAGGAESGLSVVKAGARLGFGCRPNHEFKIKIHHLLFTRRFGCFRVQF